MKTIALIASCLASVVFSIEASWQKEFTLAEYALLHAPKIFGEWVTAFEKVYKSEEEKVHRFRIWLDNLKYIAEHNSKEDKTFTMKLNQFGDLTGDEFLHYIHGDKGACYAQNDGIRKLSSFTKSENKVKVAANPTTVDWVSQGKVTPVKNQGQCGSCWAFSATGSTESAIAISTGKLESLSEQQLVDCSKEYGNEGCNGGIMQDAFKYIQANGGLCSEAEYPYKGVDGTCKSSTCGTKYDKISGYSDVTKDNEDDLETATVKQPISVAVEADQSTFQFYSKGTIMTGNCGTRTDHGVLVVGYNNDASTKYWIVKNSWGTTWGNEGYCNICKDCNKNGNEGECGINTDPSHPNA